MFTIRIADIPVGIDNRHDFVRMQCKKYVTDEKPAFTVSVSEEEIKEEESISTPEVKNSAEDLAGYCESVCFCRKISFELTLYGGILFHSAALMYKGKAYLFSAPSGTGKTTHIRLWHELLGEQVSVINGDKPILRIKDGVLYAYGTPWSGKEGWHQPICAPVGGVCFLRRGEKNGIERLSVEESAHRAMKQVLYPSDPEKLTATLGIVDRLVCDYPAFLLDCTISEEAARLSFSAMTGEEV